MPKIAEARALLERLNDALLLPPQARAAEAILVLSTARDVIKNLLDILDSFAVDPSGPIEELRAALNELRNQLWSVNQEVSRVTGFPGDLSVPTGPIAKSVTRVANAITKIRELYLDRSS